jgi:hypothetical protein
MKTQIFHHAKIRSSKNPLKETKIIPDIITLKLISSFNTSQNIIFQKSSCKNRPIMQGPKSLKLLYSITSLNPVPNAQVCVFDDTYYKITTTNYISKTSLYITLLGSFWGNLFSLFQPEIYFFYTF